MLRAFSASYYTQSITTQDFELFVTNYLGAHAHGGSNSIQWENLLETTGLPLFTVRPYTKKGVQTMHQLALAYNIYIYIYDIELLTICVQNQK